MKHCRTFGKMWDPCVRHSLETLMAVEWQPFVPLSSLMVTWALRPFCLYPQHTFCAQWVQILSLLWEINLYIMNTARFLVIWSALKLYPHILPWSKNVNTESARGSKYTQVAGGQLVSRMILHPGLSRTFLVLVLKFWEPPSNLHT